MSILEEYGAVNNFLNMFNWYFLYFQTGINVKDGDKANEQGKKKSSQ